MLMYPNASFETWLRYAAKTHTDYRRKGCALGNVVAKLQNQLQAETLPPILCLQDLRNHIGAPDAARGVWKRYSQWRAECRGYRRMMVDTPRGAVTW